VQRAHLREERFVVELERRQVLSANDRAAEPGKIGGEDVGDALPIRLVIVDHERAPEVQAPGVRSRRGTLPVVGGAHTEERGVVRTVGPQAKGIRTHREVDCRGGHRDQRKARGVRDRDLGLGDVGIHRTEYGEHRVVGRERPHVLRTLSRVVFTLHAIVEIVEIDARTAGKAATIRVVDREDHRVTDG
jgi:hypothetical protein